MTSNKLDAGNGVPRLRLGEVHVWHVPVVAAMPSIDLLAGLLDRTERADSFKNSRDRSRYIAAHGALRWLLGAYLEAIRGPFASGAPEAGSRVTVHTPGRVANSTSATMVTWR